MLWATLRLKAKFTLLLKRGLKLWLQPADELKPYPLAALGWVHYKRQEFDRAIDCLRRSSERAAAPTTLHHLGMAYLAAGKPEEAKAAFSRAKTVAPGGAIEDRMMQQVRSNLRLVEKVGGKKRGDGAAVAASRKP